MSTVDNHLKLSNSTMKNYIILLIILSKSAFAQITLSGANNYTNANGAYNLNSNYFTVPYPTIGFKDVGTFSYKFTPSNNGIDYWIVRKNNYWQVEQHYNAGAVFLLYRTQNTNTDPVPPCNAIWQIWNGGYYDYGVSLPTYSGNNEVTMILSGSCSCPASLTSGLYTNYIQLPILTTPNYATFASPTKGMINFNSNLNTQMVYDGGSWNEVLFNRDTDLKGKLSLSGNLLMKSGKIIFGNNFTPISHSIGVNVNNSDLEITNSSGQMTVTSDGKVYIKGYSSYQNSTLSVGGSVSFPVRTPLGIAQTAATLDINEHTYINNSTNPLTLTIPDPTLCRGRQYYIINHGTQNITTSYQIKTGYASQTNTIFQQERFHIVSDGTYWHKAN